MGKMTPAGYMAKRICKKADWLKAPKVEEICSVGDCVNDDFADYIAYWKHNGWWFFDSPEIIRQVSQENSIDLAGTSLFYYEVHEAEFDGAVWKPFKPERGIPVNVEAPKSKRLEGFDVVTFWAGNTPECSPLSCNSLAEALPTNAHCLFDSFEEAETSLNAGGFTGCEPGPYRIFAVYSVDWPEDRSLTTDHCPLSSGHGSLSSEHSPRSLP